MAVSRGRRQAASRARIAGAVKGSARVRQLLRRLPGVVRSETVVELHVTGRDILRAVKARTPRLTGRLAAGLTHRVLPRTLRLQVGLLGTPKGRAKLFYGRIQDLGRREQAVNVTRRVDRYRGPNRGRLVKARGRLTLGQLRRVGSAYLMAVPQMAGKRFVTGRYPDLRRTLNDNLRGIFGRALGRTAAGDFDD